MRAGDIETNPGPPSIPEPMLLEEQNLNSTLNKPDYDLFPTRHFFFEEAAISAPGIILIREKCHNFIYSCSHCNSLNDCFKNFMKFYVKQAIPFSNKMVTMIMECLHCLRCAYCLNKTKHRNNRFLPNGFVCNEDCENKYMNEFICTYSDRLRQVIFNNEHRARAMWIKHLGLRIMNNIGRVPTCGDHFTYKVCITDIITKCLIEKYHLNYANLFQETTLGGASLLEQLRNYINKGKQYPISEKING